MVMQHTKCGFALVDAVVGGALLSIALVVILGIAARCVDAQRQGQRMADVAMLADGLLHEVAALGPDVYLKQAPEDGYFEPPFEQYSYELQVEDQGVGRPYRVSARIKWMGISGEQSELVETLLAARQIQGRDIEDASSREPDEAVDR